MSTKFRRTGFGARSHYQINRPPLALIVAIHMHCFSERMPNQDSPAVQEWITKLVNHGIIETTCDPNFETGYRTTPKGEAWINACCAVPFPEAKWVIPALDSSASRE